MIKSNFNQNHIHFGYLLVEFLISLLLFSMFSSLILYIQFSVTTSWRHIAEQKKALWYAQSHLDALLYKKIIPEVDKKYTITVSTHDFFPKISAINFSFPTLHYQKKYSLITVTCSWCDNNNRVRTVIVTSGGV